MNNSMWSSLGFRESPYNTRPLQPIPSDVELLIGRDDEAVEFATRLETTDHGCLVISGDPGVGKTSFFNIQQIRLETGKAPFGPRVLAARKIYSVKPDDTARDVALGCLDSIASSGQQYCEMMSRSIPPVLQQIIAWRGGSTSVTGFSLTALGFGGGVTRNVALPNPEKVPIEAMCDIMAAISICMCREFSFHRVMACIDNVENMPEPELLKLVTVFRDTLFAIPNMWLIIIGQSGLADMIQAKVPKVGERIAGAIELKTLSLRELYDAIGKRVERFHKEGKRLAPLSSDMHQLLYNSSLGEIRFIFQQCGDVCFKLVTNTRKKLNKEIESLDVLLAKMMSNGQIPDDLARQHLEEIVHEKISALRLTEKEMEILQQICKKDEVTAKDSSLFGVKDSSYFTERYLNKFTAHSLLHRVIQNRQVRYRPRGFASIGKALNMFDDKAFMAQ